jgi:hypothetical protein
MSWYRQKEERTRFLPEKRDLLWGLRFTQANMAAQVADKAISSSGEFEWLPKWQGIGMSELMLIGGVAALGATHGAGRGFWDRFSTYRNQKGKRITTLPPWTHRSGFGIDRINGVAGSVMLGLFAAYTPKFVGGLHPEFIDGLRVSTAFQAAQFLAEYFRSSIHARIAGPPLHLVNLAHNPTPKVRRSSHGVDGRVKGS